MSSQAEKTGSDQRPARLHQHPSHDRTHGQQSVSHVAQKEADAKYEGRSSSARSASAKYQKAHSEDHSSKPVKYQKMHSQDRPCHCHKIEKSSSHDQKGVSDASRCTMKDLKAALPTESLDSSSRPVALSPAATKCKNSIYGQIIDKKIKVEIIHEDENIMVFFDPEPQAPIHFVVVPKKPLDMLENVSDEDESLLGKLLLTAARTAKKLDCVGGYRVVINNGRNACQKVNYLHVHVFGGGQLGWPPC